jgi:TPR repeat protein
MQTMPPSKPKIIASLILMAVLYALIFQPESASSINHRGYVIYHGKGVAKDPVEGLRLWKLAVEKGLDRAVFNVGVAYNEGIAVPRDVEEAITWFRKADALNFPAASFNIGKLLQQATPPRHEESLAALKRSAELGYPDAFASVGYVYEHGIGVEKNTAEAIRWYEKGVEKNDIWSANNLGLAYLNGEGVEKNLDKARELFLNAAAQNNSASLQSLGYIYHNGIGVPKDDTIAAGWYEKAMQQENYKAQTMLAFFNYYGTGVEKNQAKARQLLKLPAQRKDPKAQYLLGYMEIYGQGGPRDIPSGTDWLRLAAEGGETDAQTMLGSLFNWQVHLPPQCPQGMFRHNEKPAQSQSQEE